MPPSVAVAVLGWIAFRWRASAPAIRSAATTRSAAAEVWVAARAGTQAGWADRPSRAGSGSALAAFEERGEQVGPEPVPDVLARPAAQQMQSGDLGRVAQGAFAVPGQGLLDHDPDGAEDLAARAYRDRDPRLGRDPLQIQRLVVAVEQPERTPLLKGPQLLRRDLTVEDRRDPGLVALVLTAGEREHPAVAVLDRHRPVEQRGDRVGQREQVSGERLFGRLPDELVDREHRPQERRDLRPGGARHQTEHRDRGLVDGRLHRFVHGDRGSYDDGRRAEDGGPLDQAPGLGRAVDPDAEDDRPRQACRGVVRVVDEHPADRPRRIRFADRGHDEGRPQVREDAAERGSPAHLRSRRPHRDRLAGDLPGFPIAAPVLVGPPSAAPALAGPPSTAPAPIDPPSAGPALIDPPSVRRDTGRRG